MTESTNGKDVVLRAEGVSHSYGDLNVLDGVSVSLRQGKVHALVGSNGSGKTTLLRILAGLLSPNDGTVETVVEGEKRTVGYLPQRPAFRTGFTAEETLRFYTRLLETDDGVTEALEAVGLSEASDRRVSGLSGGMTRLLGIAQARVGNPPIMMLDEPTSGLDPAMTGRIFSILNDLADEGATVLLTTHDLDRVARNADETVIIHDRAVAESGSPDEIVKRYDGKDLSEVFDDIVGNGGKV
jgi:ABC-type multidrug transport system ATPase subunit